jgi:hypothetical protein
VCLLIFKEVPIDIKTSLTLASGLKVRPIPKKNQPQNQNNNADANKEGSL